VVGSNDKVIGVVGMKEIIDSNWKASRTVGDLQKVSAGSTIVETVCTTHAVTVDWGDSLADATDLMVSNGFSSLPVVDSSGLVGIVTEFDITELISASRDRDQMYVQISGLEDDDKDAIDAIYKDIEAMVVKVSKIYRPESITMHVGRYNDNGGNYKYSISARLYINGKVVPAKVVEWDLLDAVSGVLRNMEAAVVDMKDSVVSSRRRK
jgi:CBS domain-containing protein